MKLNQSKCEIGQSKIKVLGHIVSNNCIEMDRDKVSAIVNLEIPKCKTDVQRILGLIGFYRKFIQNFAEITKPMTNLLKDGATFQWGEEQIESFKMIKESLTSFPVLRLPDFKKQFRITADASGIAIGGILGQLDENGNEYVCGYVSRQLNKHEINYTITERECLAVIWTIKQFRHLLKGTKFEIITDHSALTWLKSMKDPEGRLARWALFMQSFDYVIKYRKGIDNSNADCLSRRVLTLVASISLEGDRKDIFYNEQLFQFVTTGKLKKNLQVKTKEKIELQAKKYKFEDEEILIKFGDNWKVIPSPAKRNEVIDHAHEMGHFHYSSTLLKIQEKYYWCSIAKDIKKRNQKCEI